MLKSAKWRCRVTRCLADIVRPEEVERVKYLPQDHVEKVCNELVGLGEEGFERELKSVIFSHVPEAQRLWHATLDDLVRFQTGEKQKRIDSLIKQLREISRSRAILEAQTDPIVKREILDKIKQRELELQSHDKAKPIEKPTPSDTPNNVVKDTVLLRDLAAAENKKKALSEQVAVASENLGIMERRLAVAKRLIEKLENFQKDFEVFKVSLVEDAAELHVKVDDLVTFSIRCQNVENIRDEANTTIMKIKKELDNDNPPGLRKQIADVEAIISDLHTKLDAPNRVYQAYLKDLADWEEKRAKIEGKADEPGAGPPRGVE